jgi:SAM-dependent methyltransferase
VDEDAGRLDLLRAGAAAVDRNTPMGTERMDRLAGRLGERGVGSLLDLGCGTAALIRRCAERLPGLRVRGVEIEPSLARLASSRAEASTAADRIEIAVADARETTGPAEVVVVAGVSHVFDGVGPMLRRVAAVHRPALVVLGEGFWAAAPDSWCREVFGPLPRGLDGLGAAAAGSGWLVVDSDAATPEEWDEFESAWTAGVAGSGLPGAGAFAERRRDEYELHYRGVLGFGWLLLEPSTATVRA